MKIDDYDIRHLRNIGLTDRQIARIFNSAAEEAAKIGMKVTEIKPGSPFRFSDYPQTKKLAQKMLDRLRKKIETVIISGIETEWTLANNKNNVLCDRVFGDNKYKLTKAQERRYYSNSDKALEAFLERKTNGLNLSDRVWKYSNQFKDEIETGLDLGIRNGLSAAEMARDLKQYLQYPDKLFRRVRDERGQLHLSKAAKDFHPGTGVYRSSFKNARRLAATETNMAYRTSDHTRWQQLDFVVGIKISLSNNHTLNGVPFTDVCDDLQGRYPKDFKFTGWHPLCRCFAVPVLKTEAEMKADNVRMLRGEEPSEGSVNEVGDVPENFKKWVTDNADRIAVSGYKGTTPYFLLDNDRYVHLDSFKATKLQKFTVDSRNEYLGHDTKQWQREFFNKENGGYLLVDKERVAHSKVSKNEKAKFDKEYAMSMVFAKNGYKIEMLKKVPRVSSPDVTINGMKADLKCISGHNNIVRDAKKAVRKQGAEMALFEFEKETKEIYNEIEKLSGKGIHGRYYFTGKESKIYAF
jgi:hypothetical protein